MSGDLVKRIVLTSTVSSDLTVESYNDDSSILIWGDGSTSYSLSIDKQLKRIFDMIKSGPSTISIHQSSQGTLQDAFEIIFNQPIPDNVGFYKRIESHSGKGVIDDAGKLFNIEIQSHETFGDVFASFAKVKPGTIWFDFDEYQNVYFYPSPKVSFSVRETETDTDVHGFLRLDSTKRWISISFDQ